MSKKKKKKGQLPFRINILFFVVFLLFSVLILQLGVVQILNGQEFQQEIERTVQDTTSIPVPRGKIYDSKGNVLVDNEAHYSITYTPPKGVQAEDRLKIARELANYIAMDDEDTLSKVTERDKKDYWYLLNKDEADSRIENIDTTEMSNGEIYSLTMEEITEKEISNFTKEELEVIAIKKELDQAYSLTPHVVKNENVTAEEYATVAENLDELPGINATTDWTRSYPYGDTLSSVLGNISTQDQGIPADEEELYLSKGYSRNDRVGKSGLEQYYEEMLRGRKEQIQYTMAKNGTIIDSDTIVEGERGKDLILTVDMELQKAVDQIVLEEMQAAKRKQPYENRYLTDALAVVMNPKTGEILANTAIHYNSETNEYSNAAYKTMTDGQTPGSVVKGATILAGLDSGAISPGQYIYDSPFKVKDTPTFRSYSSNIGSVDDIAALKESSNIYMYYTALRMAGDHRYPFPEDGKLQTTNPNAFRELRNYFNQFGLGISTGVDFPNESIGYQGNTTIPNGDYLNHAIGQYDQYTTMQIAQYAATIANDGYRVRPHFLKQIHEPTAEEDEFGSLYKTVNTTILNKIEMDESYLDRVQEGFRQSYQNRKGTAYAYFGDKDYNPAGKSGTAQYGIYENGQLVAETNNINLVGYAPADDPEVAFAVVVPKAGKENDHKANYLIGERILDTYFEMKENPSSSESETTEQAEE